MYLTKLSRKYHLLSREQKLQQIREISVEDSENEESESSNRQRENEPRNVRNSNNIYRPSTDVIVISSTSSDSGSGNDDRSARFICYGTSLVRATLELSGVKQYTTSLILQKMLHIFH